MKPTIEQLYCPAWWSKHAPEGAEYWGENGKWYKHCGNNQYSEYVGAMGGWLHNVDVSQRRLHARPIATYAKPVPVSIKAIDIQEGGDHYKSMKIQPVEYIHANGIGYFEGCVIKYVSRWKAKGGIEDLRKAKHFIDLLIEFEGSEPADQ